MPRTPTASVPFMTGTDENAAEERTRAGTAAHPRFAEALRELGLDEVNGRVRRFPAATRRPVGGPTGVCRVPRQRL